MRKHLGVDFNEGCPLDGRKKGFIILLVSVKFPARSVPGVRVRGFT